MIVQNKGGKGNPNHDEEGKFTSAGGVSSKVENNNKNLDKFKDVFGDIFGETEEDAAINAMFGWNPKKSEDNVKSEKTNYKKISEMSQEELLLEIKDHTKYLEEKGINFDQFKNAFNNDIKLKCANYRTMHDLCEEYNLDLNGCLFVNSNKYKSDSGSLAYVQTRFSFGSASITDDTFEVILNRKLNYNAKEFTSYDYVVKEEKRQINLGYHVDVDDEHLAMASTTHEFGHILHNQIFKEMFVNGKDYEIYKKYIDDFDNRGLYIVKVGRETYYANSAAKKLASNDIKKMMNKKIDEIKNEIQSIYVEKGYGNSASFLKDTSKYGGTKSSEWFAETFSSLHGGKPSKAALALNEWLVRNNYKKGE